MGDIVSLARESTACVLRPQYVILKEIWTLNMVPPDYMQPTSRSDWRNQVIQSLELSFILIRDADQTFFEATKILSDTYLLVHEQRAAERPQPSNEYELSDIFWDLQRSSTVVDAVVGSACVVLMRWMDQAKRVAIGDFILLETEFPFETDSEPKRDKWNRHHSSVMQDYGSKVPGTQIGGARAIWQIGNVFKHGGGNQLHSGTEKVAKELGFSSQMMLISEHEGEEDLRQMALREVECTLDADSIERMALQLGCGPALGLMPLYDHVRSWQEAIERKLRDEQAALRSLS